MIKAIGIALQGLTTATKQVEASANRIANPNNADTLAEDLINMKLGETLYKANLATVRTADEMSDELLRIFDERV